MGCTCRPEPAAALREHTCKSEQHQCPDCHFPFYLVNSDLEETFPLDLPILKACGGLSTHTSFSKVFDCQGWKSGSSWFLGFEPCSG